MKERTLSCAVVGFLCIFLIGCPTSDDINLNDDAGRGQQDIVLTVDTTPDFGPIPTDVSPPPPDVDPPPSCTADADCLDSITDLQPCERAACDVDTGNCIRDAQIDGATCDDDNPCTITSCQNGLCEVSGMESCDDGNPCTTDKCIDSADGCQNIPNLDTCDDGNACTVGDQCGGGVCLPGNLNTCGCQGKPLGEICDDGDSSTLGDFCLNDTCAGFQFTVFNPAADSTQATFRRLEQVDGTMVAIGSDVRSGSKWSWAVEIQNGTAVYHQQSARSDTEYLATNGIMAAGTDGKVSHRTSGQNWEIGGPLQSAIDAVPSSLGPFSNITAVWNDDQVALFFGRNASDTYMKVTRCDGIDATPTCKSIGFAPGATFIPRFAVVGGSGALTGPLVATNGLGSSPKNVIVSHPGANSNIMEAVVDITGLAGMAWKDLAIAPDDQYWGVGSVGLTMRGTGSAAASLPALSGKDLHAVAILDEHVMIFGHEDTDPSSAQMLWLHERGNNDYESSAYVPITIPIAAVQIIDVLATEEAITVITAPTVGNTTNGAWIGTRKTP